MIPTFQPWEFLTTAGAILDVRSPGEYDQGHIPGAISFPLFDNQERAEIGTCYKQQGQAQAVELGLSSVRPKLDSFVVQAKQLAPQGQVRVHCWRGGMRSASMAQLLQAAGLDVALLQGGYKAFRQWVRSTLSQPKPILILGGATGTGKTQILAALAQQGEQILDLEDLAHHRGSSYGSLGLPPQPTTEQFENAIALQWQHFDPHRPVWIEAESRQIGTCRIPPELFEQMQQAPGVQILRSDAERIQLLINIYGGAEGEGLITATERLRKRLGGLRTQTAIEAIRQGNLAEAVATVLEYYDKTYQYDLQQRPSTLYPLDLTGLSLEASAQQLIAKAREQLPFDV